MFYALIPYILLTLGLAATLCLFLALKREMYSSARRQRLRLDAMSSQLKEASERAAATVPPPPPAPGAVRSGFNLNRRVQAMRMVRRGEDLSHIAAVLGVTRREIELLIRVQNAAKSYTAKTGS